jgi:hypothetical protein
VDAIADLDADLVPAGVGVLLAGEGLLPADVVSVEVVDDPGALRLQLLFLSAI